MGDVIAELIGEILVRAIVAGGEKSAVECFQSIICYVTCWHVLKLQNCAVCVRLCDDASMPRNVSRHKHVLATFHIVKTRLLVSLNIIVLNKLSCGRHSGRKRPSSRGSRGERRSDDDTIVGTRMAGKRVVTDAGNHIANRLFSTTGSGAD